MRVVFAKSAISDLDRIYDHLALRSTISAQNVEGELRSACFALADFPYASSPTDESDVRRVAVLRYRYTIFFRVDDDRAAVQIVRIIYSGRVKDLGRLPVPD